MVANALFMRRSSSLLLASQARPAAPRALPLSYRHFLLNQRHGASSIGSSNRQRSHSNPSILEYHHGTLFKRLLYCRQVGHKHRDLTLRPSVDRLTEEDHRRLRLLPERKKGAKIGVRRN